MHAILLQAAVILLVSGAAGKSVAPPKEIEERVKAFEESVQANHAFTEQMKTAISAGANFYGKPYFIGGNGGNFGGDQQHENLTFCLFNSYEKPYYRAYSIRSLDAGVQTFLKTVMFAFEHKANWVAVYVTPADPNQVLYINVYP